MQIRKLGLLGLLVLLGLSNVNAQVTAPDAAADVGTLVSSVTSALTSAYGAIFTLGVLMTLGALAIRWMKKAGRGR